jgi:methyl-accepting chemotaxis protein
MNLAVEKKWTEYGLGVKFAIILTSIVFTLLTALGVFVLHNHKNTITELVDERMHAQVNDLSRILSLSTIETAQETINEINYFENGHPLIIDSEGIILIHPTDKGQNISRSSFYAAMVKQKSGKLSYKWPETATNSHDRLLYFRYDQTMDVFVAASIAEDEVINKPVAATRNFILIAIVLMVLLLSVVIKLLMDQIIMPINRVAQILAQLSKGKQIDTIENSRKDEIGHILESLNNLIDGLKETALFANEIEKKNFDHPYHPLSDEDALGNALIDMRESLIKAAKDEENRKAEDFKTNWATEGLAKFSDILRMDNDNLEKLSFSIISGLVKYLNVNQGGLFILNDDNADEIVLELTACYAYDRQKFLSQTIAVGEGLTGTCYLEKETIYIKEIPDDYIKITSGLGEASPGYLLVVPLKLNNIVYGVVELASFNEFQKYEIAFVEKIAESIASTLSTVKTNIRTSWLLEQSQQQAEEMRAQEEEMRQNMEELNATQESMEQKRQESEKLAQKLEWDNMLFNLLLENLPSRVTYKDSEGKYLRVNMAKVKALNIKDQSEVIGKTDADVFGTEHSAKALEDEKLTIKSGVPVINKEELIKFKDGTVAWGLTNRVPIKDKQEKIVGSLVFTQDITTLKNYESLNKVSDQLLGSIAQKLPVLKFSLNEDGLIESIYGKALDVMGLQQDQIIGKEFGKIFTDAKVTSLADIGDEGYSFLQTGKGWEMNLLVMRNNTTDGGYTGVGIVV